MNQHEPIRNAMYQIVFASFEVAKLAKRKRFDVPCRQQWNYSMTEQEHEEDGKTGSFGWEKGELSIVPDFIVNHDSGDHTNEHWYMCAAPTLDVLQRWLRQEKSIEVYHIPQRMPSGVNKYAVNIQRQGESTILIDSFDTPEDALNAGIKKSLELLK